MEYESGCGKEEEEKTLNSKQTMKIYQHSVSSSQPDSISLSLSI